MPKSPWEILVTDTYETWFFALTEAEQIDVLAMVQVLEIKGPLLGRPYVDSLKGTRKVANLKELRIQHAGKPYSNSHYGNGQSLHALTVVETSQTRSGNEPQYRFLCLVGARNGRDNFRSIRSTTIMRIAVSPIEYSSHSILYVGLYCCVADAKMGKKTKRSMIG